MNIELLYWVGCPSHERALEELRAAVAAAGLSPNSIEVREVLTQEQAEHEGFVGSPTIRVNGRDVVDPGDAPRLLTCRVYRRADGRYSPLPDPEVVRDALRPGETGVKV